MEGEHRLPATGRIARFAAGHQAVAVAVALPDSLVPLLVLAYLTDSDVAHYYAAFTIAFSLRLLATNLASALTVEGARGEDDLRALTRRVSRFGAAVLLPASLFVVIAAEPILHLFGGDYARSASELLRWFGAALPFAAIVVIGLALERVHQRIVAALVIAGVSTATTIAVDVALLGDLGIRGAGIGFLAGQVAGALLVLLAHVLRRGRLRVVSADQT